MALYAFYHEHPDLLGASVEPNGVLPYYIVTQMPHGISGLFIAAIIAALGLLAEDIIKTFSGVKKTALNRFYQEE